MQNSRPGGMAKWTKPASRVRRSLSGHIPCLLALDVSHNSAGSWFHLQKRHDTSPPSSYSYSEEQRKCYEPKHFVSFYYQDEGWLLVTWPGRSRIFPEDNSRECSGPLVQRTDISVTATATLLKRLLTSRASVYLLHSGFYDIWDHKALCLFRILSESLFVSLN